MSSLKKRISLKTVLVAAMLSGCFFWHDSASASENERYKAIPASPGGPILIIDTKEGHLWTWNNNGVEETDAAGVNPRIRYQGNVRKNMKTPEKNTLPSLSNDSDRLINQKF